MKTLFALWFALCLSAGAALPGPAWLASATKAATGGGGTSFTFVQYAQTNYGATSSSTVARKFNSANTAGNLLVAVVSENGSTAISVADSAGNTYTLATNTAWNSSGNILGIWFATNCASSAANTVTATMENNSYHSMSIAEYSGAVLNSPQDYGAITNGTTGIAGLYNSPAITTAANGELLVACASCINSSMVSTNTFTERTVSGHAYADKIQASAGAIAYGVTYSNGGDPFVIVIYAFKHQ